MTDDTNPSASAFAPPPISDAEQRLMISTELGTIRWLIAAGAFSVEGLQQVNHQLVLLPGALTPAAAQMSQLREVVVNELHDALMRATGVERRYWQYPHRIDTPDDASSLDAPPERTT